MSARKSLIGATALFVVACVLFVSIHRALTPRVTSAYVSSGGGEKISFLLPLARGSEGRTAEIELNLDVSSIAVSQMHFQVDDCLDRVVVNGQEVGHAKLPYCDYVSGVTVDLEQYLNTGANTVVLHVTDTGGMLKFSMRPSIYKGALGILWLLAFIVVVGYGVFMIRRLSPESSRTFHVSLFLIILLGTLLRLGYVYVTPLSMRGHDIYAHTAYVEHVMEYWTIPAASDGWEYHQPPLYYFLAAKWGNISSAMGYNIDQVFRQLQYTSMVQSVVVLLLGVWIGFMLFPGKKRQSQLLLYSALLATFPGLIYFASRVSNAALYQVLLFFGAGILLRWWHKNGKRDWILLAVVIGVALITKASALLLLFGALGCLVLKRGWHPKKWWRECGLCLLIVIVLSAWVPYIRLFVEEDTTRTVHLGNTEMAPQVLLVNTPKHYLTFNPMGVLEFPFNNPWRGNMRRDNYWEYLFKSAYFGEWRFNEVMGLVRQILFFAMGLIPLALMGIVADIRKRQSYTVPLALLGLLLLAAAVAYRFNFTCACNQDFRLSSLLVLPMMYFAVRSLDVFPPVGKWIVGAWMVTSCAVLAYFFGYLTIFL